mgnify:CR=1 FL=1
MKNFLLVILSFPLFCFASFPIKSDFKKSDTIIINGKIYIQSQVDSLISYPIEKEPTVQYKERTKKQSVNGNKPRVSIWIWFASVFLIVGGILGYLVIKAFFGLIENAESY